MFCLITLNHRQIQCQWGIHAGVALAIDIEMPPMIAEFNLTCEDSNKVPFNMMKNVTIEFPNGYDEVFSMTAIGRGTGSVINVATCAFELSKGERIYCGEDGKWEIGKSAKEVCTNCGFLKKHCVCEKPQTQADRIRAMTDEELAEFLNTLFIEGQIEELHEQYPDSVFNRKDSTLKYLKSEVEE